MKIALVENFGADFVGARLRFSIFLKENGVNVTAIVPEDGHRDIIENSGIRVIEVGGNIRGKGIVNKIDFAKKLKKVLKEEEFDIVHFYRLQPNIIGTFIAGIYTKSKIVNHITGLGVAFTSNSFKNKCFQFVIKSLYRFNSLSFKPYTVYQNEHDKFDLGIKIRTICIAGSAVNEDRFNKEYIINNNDKINTLKKELDLDQSVGVKTFIFVSRLLKEKGVMQLIEAFININSTQDKKANLLVVGWSDPENPSAVKSSDLKKYFKKDKFIKFLGKRSDVNDLIALSDVSILPTYYREGTPRFLLESMAMSKAIITTDMPGCNHLIPNNENGILIQPKSIEAIEDAVLTILNKDLIALGKVSNKLYNDLFSEKIVYSSILNLYKSIKK
tara:strand:- start:9327 stop:10487 length:1161 start_codon:yes stop_codon:yes gene_type:complete